MAGTWRDSGGTLLFLACMAVLLSAAGCSSDPEVVIQQGADDAVGADQAPAPSAELFELLRGTAWTVETVDSLPSVGLPTTVTFHASGTALEMSLADQCASSGVTFDATVSTVLDTNGVGGLCNEAYGELFTMNAALVVTVDGQLRIVGNGHEMVAQHFTSVSQTGPVNRPTMRTSATPPEYAPSEDSSLSGVWTIVGLWADDGAVNLEDLSGRSPTLRILGRQLGGNDGCNGHGGGTFHARPDGTVSISQGHSTAIGCPDNAARSAANSAMLQATQWGRTSAGNLVLTDGNVVAELERTEQAPLSPIVGVGAPLNQIWTSDAIDDSETVPNTVGVTWIDVGEELVVLEMPECGFSVSYEPTFGGASEGPISLTRTDSPASECHRFAELAIDALSRADYFVSGEGTIMFWEGAAPLAVFGHVS